MLIAVGFWYFYGDTYERSGLSGVAKNIRTDVSDFVTQPEFQNTLHAISAYTERLLERLSHLNEDKNNSESDTPEQPKLNQPSEQTFSIHNVEINDNRSEVEEKVGNPQRSSENDYGANWFTYHDEYHNFFMVAYDQENKVAGLYTNQDLLSSEKEISFETNKDTVLSTLNEPIQTMRKGLVQYQVDDTGEYDIFQIDQNYVTIFYDKHDNWKIAAIQIIREDLEQQKEEYFGEPSNELRNGLEKQLFDLVNASRIKHGLSPLSWDHSTLTTSRDHSEDMAHNHYFGHTNLDGQSPFDRLEEDGVTYRMAGENLASGQPSSIYAHAGLMNSKGHRENILKEGFETLSVGVAFNEEAQPFYTETFLTK